MEHIRKLYDSVLFSALFMFCVLLISNEVVAQEPDLIVTEISAPSFASTQHQVEVSWLVSNQGNGDILERWWCDRLYLSADDKLDDSDTPLGYYGFEELPAGGSCTGSVQFTVPNAPAGSYYLIVITDRDNYIYETGESNNIRSQLFEIRVPDLIVSSINVQPEASSNQRIDISWTITNQGNGDIIGSSWCYDQLYFSIDNNLDGTDTYLTVYSRRVPFPAGSNDIVRTIVTVPDVAPGVYYFIAITDQGNHIYESNESNNTRTQAITIINASEFDAPVATLGEDITPGSANDVAFSPKGAEILAGYSDGNAILWNTNSYNLIGIFRGHTGSLSSVDFSSNGEQAITGADDGTARLWNTATQRQIRSFASQPGVVCPVAFSPNNTTVLAGSGMGTARLWDIASGDVLQVFIGHTARVTSVDFSPDGTKAFTGSLDGTVFLWDVMTGAKLRIFSADEQPANISDSSIEAISPKGVKSLAISPDGLTLMTGCSDGVIRLWDIPTGNHILSLYNGSSVSDVAFSPDGKYVLSCGGRLWEDMPNARLWDRQTGANIANFRLEWTTTNAIAFSPDRSSFATADTDGMVRLWNSGLSPISIYPTIPLAIGVPHTVSLWTNSFLYYKVDVPEGQNLLIKLDQVLGQIYPAPPLVQIFAGYEKLPTTYNYDYFAEVNPQTQHAELAIGNTQAGKYYIRVQAPRLGSDIVTTTIEAIFSDLHIISITPNHGGNTGQVTINAIGVGFQNGLTAKLTCIGKPDIIAGLISINPEGNKLVATFNLTGRQAGVYDLVITNPDGKTDALQNAFEIESIGEKNLWIRIIGREQIRLGRVRNCSISYGNSGSVDAYDCLLIIRIPAFAEYSIDFPLLPWVDWNNIPLAFGAKVDSDIVIPIWLLKIAAGSSHSINLRIKILQAPPGRTLVPIEAEIFHIAESEFSRSGNIADIENSPMFKIMYDQFKENISFPSLPGDENIVIDDYYKRIKEAQNQQLQAVMNNLFPTYTIIGCGLGLLIGGVFGGLPGAALGGKIGLEIGGVIDLISFAYEGVYKPGKMIFEARRELINFYLEIPIDPNDKIGPPGFDLEGTPDNQLKRFVTINSQMRHNK